MARAVRWRTQWLAAFDQQLAPVQASAFCCRATLKEFF